GCIGNNDVDLKSDELGRDLGEALAAPLGPAILDRDGATLDPTELMQPLHKSGDPLAPGRRCGRAQEPDDRQLCRLLRARCERPRSRAAEERDELAAVSHSITSSARCCRNQGTSRPSALAVLRLTTSSNVVGACTGRSPGFSPRRT